MKYAISTMIIAATLLTGCDKSGSGQQGADNQLTAADLALLTDFHAWKVSIPEIQKPIKAIRLVIVNHHDGSVTVTQKFSTGDNLKTNCTSFLLGISVVDDKFTGHLLTRSADGGGLGWNLDFTDALANANPGWSVPGSLVWSGNRAYLATSGKDPNNETELAIELQK